MGGPIVWRAPQVVTRINNGKSPSSHIDEPCQQVAISCVINEIVSKVSFTL